MRVVTLGGLGATAPVVNQMGQPYFAAYESRSMMGMGDGLSDLEQEAQNRGMYIGLAFGLFIGAFVTREIMKKR